MNDKKDPPDPYVILDIHTVQGKLRLLRLRNDVDQRNDKWPGRRRYVVQKEIVNALGETIWIDRETITTDLKTIGLHEDSYSLFAHVVDNLEAIIEHTSTQSLLRIGKQD